MQTVGSPALRASALLAALLLPSLLLLLSASSVSGQTTSQYEFCYILQGSGPSWGVTNHGVFTTIPGTASNVLSIQTSNSSRSVVSVLGQTHSEALQGIQTANGRVDTSLFLNGQPYVDGSGIQLPVLQSNTAGGQGVMFPYNSQTAPFVFISNAALSLTTQLSQAINILWSAPNYAERIDAGGATINPSSSSFYILPYSGAFAINNCSLQLYSPVCLNYPPTPPAGSVIFTFSVSAPWSNVPLTFLNDLFTQLTVAVASGGSYAGISGYLGFFLFSCYPLFSSLSTGTPTVAIYLNSQSVSSMGLNMATVTSQVYSMLSAAASAGIAGLPSSEAGLISNVACPFYFNAGTVPGVCGSSTGGGGGGVVSPGTSSGGGGGGGGGGSGLSHGAIAGIVVGSVVGAALLCLILFFLLRCLSPARDGTSKQFQDEQSQTRKDKDVEMSGGTTVQ